MSSMHITDEMKDYTDMQTSFSFDDFDGIDNYNVPVIADCSCCGICSKNCVNMYCLYCFM